MSRLKEMSWIVREVPGASLRMTQCRQNKAQSPLPLITCHTPDHLPLLLVGSELYCADRRGLPSARKVS